MERIHFDESIAEESNRINRDFEYARMEARRREEEAEERLSPWARTGSLNIIRTDFLPTPKPEPYHSGDEERY